MRTSWRSGRTAAGTGWAAWSTRRPAPAFEANDLGFQSNADRRAVSTALEYQETRPGRLFRNYQVFPFTNHPWNFDGDRVFGSYGLILSAQLRSFWNVELRGDYAPPTDDDRLTRGGPLARQPTSGDVRLTLESDTRKTTRLSLNVTQSWTAADEHQTEADLTLGVRPSAALRLSLGPALTRNHTLSQYVTAVADPAAAATFGTRYVFATLDQTEVSMITRLDWTFTPTLSLQLFLQPLISAGDYGELKEFAAPRTYDFAVYGRDQGTATAPASGTADRSGRRRRAVHGPAAELHHPLAPGQRGAALGVAPGLHPVPGLAAEPGR